MRKFLSVFLICCFFSTCFVCCGKNEKDEKELYKLVGDLRRGNETELKELYKQRENFYKKQEELNREKAKENMEKEIEKAKKAIANENNENKAETEKKLEAITKTVKELGTPIAQIQEYTNLIASLEKMSDDDPEKNKSLKESIKEMKILLSELMTTEIRKKLGKGEEEPKPWYKQCLSLVRSHKKISTVGFVSIIVIVNLCRYCFSKPARRAAAGEATRRL